MARILVVDDENNIRMMIRLALQHVGHNVETAADGNEALDKYGNGKDFDLVLLDQRMPGLEGLEVLKQMRYHNPDAKIIMATAFGTIDLAVEAMKAGATDFLRKPFTTETLRGAVQAVLQPQRPKGASGTGATYGMTTINGYRIESRPAAGMTPTGEFRHDYDLTSPTGETRTCTVILPPYLIELVKAHVDSDTLPGGDRFWHALGEEALANYVWQNAEFPPEEVLKVVELTTSLNRWIDSVLTAA
ncbi:MAG TPA: response regulator [Chthonomonadaceae bacterium]|nr:response regulator [Chthonomonadaceae bacterium]